MRPATSGPHAQPHVHRPPDPWATLRSRPLLCSAAGAVTLGFSGIFYRLAEVDPVTGTFFRFALAIPLLALLARRERGGGHVTGSSALAAGVLLALDMALWHAALDDVGAGLGTVLANTQVVFMVVLSWALLGERLTSAVAIGIALVSCGVLLISGVLEESAFGGNPARGTALAIAAGLTSALYILALRRTNLDPRRPVTPLLVVTIIGTAVTGAGGLAGVGALDLVPAARELLWLAVLAISSQVLGWLLLSVPLRTLRATTTSIVLNVQPLAALVFAALILSESPTWLQMAGGLVTLAGVVTATSFPGARTPATHHSPAMEPT